MNEIDSMRDKIHSNIDISRLLSLYLTGDLTAEEQAQLEAWLHENESNKKLLEELKSKKLRANRQEIIDRIDVQKEWERFQLSIAPRSKTIPVNWMNILRYAAVIALPLIIGAYLLLQDFTKEQYVADIPVEIQPGVKKAQLVLSNGERIDLDENPIEIRGKEKDVHIENKDQALSYSSTSKTGTVKKSALAYNHLLIGRGEEYQLVLADGTKVWLNSESKLTYPTQFASNLRVVELEGEGYFEVTKNPKAPFIVKTKQMNVEVLGTAFNVSSYQDDENMKTTLVEGSVKVSLAYGTGRDVILKPDEQAVLDINTNKLKVQVVDAEIYGRWREGVFVFEEESLEEIMRMLSRWYDIRVFFQDNTSRAYQFSGKLPRFENCNELFEMIEKTTNVRFEIKNNENVIVSTKR